MGGGIETADIPRVHLVSSEFPPVVRGGAGVHVYELHHRLAQLTDVSVSLLDSAPGEAGRATPGAIPLPIPARSRRYHGQTISSEAFALAEGEQVVHTHSLTGHIAGMRCGRAYVSTVHSIEADRPWRAQRHAGVFERAVDAERAALAGASTVICVSEAIARDLAQRYGIDQAVVIPPAYELACWYPDPGRDALPTAAVADANVDWERPFVLGTGRISTQKGYRYLFAAMRLLRRPTTFVLRAGAVETASDLAEFRASLGAVPARHTVIWLRAGLGRRGMRQLYSRAALHVSPAIYEPYGLCNVESLLCGTPVCATAVGGTPEALRDTPAILLPDPTEDPTGVIKGLAGVLETAPYDRQLRERVRAVSTRRVLARADWSRVLPRILHTYRSGSRA